jgi:hypothetical protein
VLSSISSLKNSLDSSSPCPFRGAGSTCSRPNSVEMTVTNSTCDIFWPGHTRGPPDHAMKVPRSGVISWESAPRTAPGRSQREGRKSWASGPQEARSLCRPALLT